MLAISLCLFVWLLVPSPAHARPGWVKDVLKDTAGLEVHADAAAHILYQSTQIKITRGGDAKKTVRYVARILKPEGSKRVVVRVYVNPRITVKSIKGWAIYPGGKERGLGEDDILEVSPGEAAGYYSEGRVLLAGFPDAPVGTVVAYQYEIRDEDWGSLFDRFVVQTQEPVWFSEYVVQTPKNWQVNWSDDYCETIEFEREDVTYRWTASRLAYRPDEPLMPSWPHLARIIQIECVGPKRIASSPEEGWRRVGESVSQLMAEPAIPDPAVTAQARRLTDPDLDALANVHRVADYVRDDIRYVAVEIDEGRFVPREATLTLENSFGDCKDKSTLMRAMLQAVGIHSEPVLALTDRPVMTQLPSAVQFNHCIVAMPADELQPAGTEIGGATASGWVFFDPTASSTLFGHLPLALQGTHVLLCADSASTLVRLPAAGPYQNRARYTAAATLTPEGAIRARVTLAYHGARAEASRRSLATRTELERRERLLAYLLDFIPTATLSEFRMEAEGDSVYTQVLLDAEHYAQSAGSLVFFRPNIFVTPEPTRLAAEHRVHPIWYGPAARYDYDIHWQLPEGWIPEEALTTLRDSSEAGAFTCEITATAEGVRYVASIDVYGREVSADAYALARIYEAGVSALKNLTIAAHR